MSEIDHETLEVLRSFAVGHVYEYGSPAVYHAIIDAGIALDMDDPTDGIRPRRMDLDGMRSNEIYSDDAIDEFVERYHRLSEGNDE